MQFHKILVATMLAASAFGAMSQELDPGETLQARNLATPRLHLQASRSQELAPVIAAVRAIDAVAPAQVVVTAVPNTSWASRHATQAYARSWLHGDKRAATQVVVGQAD